MSGPRSYPNPALASLRGRTDIQTSMPYYRFWRTMCRLFIPAYLKTRVFNRHYEPTCGSAVYICNHQSFMDPMLMAFGLSRPMNFMARSSLFRVAGFRQLIMSVHAFPVERDLMGLSGLKEAMRRMRGGGQVVVFAEGTRTSDGRIGQLLPGVALLAQRAADWTVPVLIDGAFEAWPRTKLLPSMGNVVIQYDKPIPQAAARSMDPRQFVRMVRDRLIAMQADVRRRVGRPELRYD